MQTSIKQNMNLYGVYKITKAKLETAEHFALNADIESRKAAGLEYLSLVNKLNGMCKTEVMFVKNLLPTVGRAAIANHLSSSSPSPSALRVNYAALGSSATAPANGDTQLGTETYRNTIAAQTNSNNIAYQTAFFSASEVTGTFAEAGLFINGTASANSGTLFSHVAVSITKSGTETLTIDWTVTIS